MSDLTYKTKNVWEAVSEEVMASIKGFNDEYKLFLNLGKTERLCVRESVRLAQLVGFKAIEKVSSLKAGDTVYMINRNKNIMLIKIGQEPIEKGINLIASHIDVPRLDLKPVPVFEEGDMVFLKTHYYGGIKKYQWTSIPLAIYGTVVKSDGSIIDVSIGNNENDAVFTVTDLLPHLASEQMQKKLSEAITGEQLNLLAGSIPGKEEKDKIKSNILMLLNEKYGILEEDFISAELEAFPAFGARDVGIDRSLIGSFGQDDRVCAFTSLKAILDSAPCKKTAVCLLVDKEEIGSMGNTGMKSRFFEDALAEVMLLTNEGFSELSLRRCLSNSKCLSADVSAAYDPAYSSVYEKMNTPFLNKGVVITKYTGSRGKSGSSDASAEFTGYVRRLFNDNNVIWQTGELGKVDAGGGGTVAQFIANLNVDVIDCGVALLSMHSPFEIASKADIYMAYKGYKAFLEG